MAKRPKKRFGKKLLKIAAIGSACFLVAVAGLFGWLRTSAGADFVFNRVVNILAAGGLKLTAAGFEGPLPSRLLIREATLADAEGPLVKVGLAEVRLAPLALLRGLVHVSLIQVENPELLRLPPSSDQPQPPSGPLRLPVGIRLDELAVSGGRVEAGALGPESPALIFQAGGQARLEGERATADLNAHLAGAGGEELAAVVIKLAADESGSPGADRMELRLQVHDQPGGLIGDLLKDPEWPGLALDLAGEGPLNDWNGRLNVSSSQWGDLAADLGFQGQSGRIWRDLVTDPGWRGRLSANLAAGPALPDQVTRLLGPKTRVLLTGQGSGRLVAADLRVTAGGEPALTLDANVSGTLKPGGGDFDFQAALKGLAGPDSADAPPLTASAQLTLDQKAQMVEALKIHGDGLEMTGSVRRRVDDGAVSAQLKMAVADGSSLLVQVLTLAGLEPEAFGGALDLAGDLDWRGPKEAASGQLTLRGQNLRWPDEQLTGFLGSTLNLAADLSGGGGRPLMAEIREARAGRIHLGGRASFQPAEVPAHSEFTAELQGGLDSLAALRPDLAGAVELELRGQGRLDDFQAEVRAAGPEVTLTSGALKQALVRVSAAGALLAEAADGGPDLTGHLALEAGDSPAGPLNVDADWRFRRSGENLTVAVADLAGKLAGLTLTGNIDADFGGDRKDLAGLLDIEISDWSGLAALSGQALSGSPARLKITLAAPEGRQTAEADLDVPGLRLGQGQETLLSLEKTSLTFKADDLFGRSDLDLNLSLGSGLAGPLAWKGGAVTAQGRAGQGDFAVRLDQTKLAGAGGAGSDGLKLGGKYDLTEDPVVTLGQLAVNLGAAGLTLKEPLRVALGPKLKISPFTAAFRPSGQLAAEVDLTPGAMKIKADLKNLPYGFFKTFTGQDLPGGEIQSLTVALDQTAGGLAGDFALKTQVAPKELKNLKPTLDLTGRLAGGSAPNLALEGRIGGGPGWKADGRFTARIPLSAGPDGGFPQPNMNGPLAGELRFTGPVAPLWALAGQPDRSVAGAAQIQAEVGGTLAKPQPKGVVYLAGGRYEDRLLGVMIKDITLEAHSTPDLPVKALLSAKDSRGGGLALEAQVRDLANPAISAKGRLSRFSPLNRDDAVVFISGTLGAEGPLSKLALSSDLTIDRGELNLELLQAQGSVSTLDISRPGDQAVAAGGGMRMNLKVALPGQFFIRGYGLESEWRGALTVGGSSRRPSLTGQVSPVRGYFEIFSKEFQFTGGEVSFNGGTTPNLNLELTNNGPNVTAIIRAGGSAKKPTLTLESRPPLPEEEVLAQVLFGKSSTSISRFEALQLAGALNELRNFGQGGGFNALGSIRAGLGLDVLRLGGSDNDRERRASAMTGAMGQEMSGAAGRAATSGGTSQSDDLSVEAGKYISDNVYVGVEHSGLGGAAVRLEVELLPSVSFEARTSSESSQIGLGWKKDY